MKPKRKSRRGFASMTPEKQRAIAAKGAKRAHALGTAHRFTSDEASAAAKLAHDRGTAHKFNSREARIAGHKGGVAKAMNRRPVIAVADQPALPSVGEAAVEVAGTSAKV